MAPTLAAFQVARWGSPRAAAAPRLIAPAQSICQPLATSGSTATFQRRESTDPNAQQNDEPSRARQAASSAHPSVGPVAIFGQKSTATPSPPSATPAAPDAGTLSPVGRTKRSTIRNQMGTMATRSAERPEGRNSSAQARTEFEMLSSRTPMKASWSSWRRVTRTRRPVDGAEDEHQRRPPP